MNDWLEVRRRAAHRRRRVILNNDGDDALSAPEPTPESFLAMRCKGLEGSHVDTVAYCTCQGFDHYTHDSRVAQLFTVTHPFLTPRNHARALIEQGRDCLSLVIDFCRANGIEAFWSIRMNDVHDNWYPWNLPDFKKKHRELLLWSEGDYGRPGDGTVEPHMYCTAVDYGQEEVRRREYDTIRDVCERYDVDGVELDYLRNPMYFRPNMEGRPVEDGHLEMMTDLVRRVRETADEIGRRRGKPILLSARVPNLLKSCRYIGLDVERWVKENLLDMLIPSIEFTPFTGDIREMAALAHGNRVPVYPCIGGGHGCDGWAGATTNALAGGADGVATFNETDPKFPAWRVLGDPAALRDADKVYKVDDLSLQVTRMHEHVIDREGRLPITLTAGSPTEVRLPIGEDLRARGTDKALTLAAVIDGGAFGDRVELGMNGRALDAEILYATDGRAPRAAGRIGFTAAVDSAAMLCGDNRVRVCVKAIEPREATPVLSDVRLRVSGRA